jgi:hypothetical protein
VVEEAARFGVEHFRKAETFAISDNLPNHAKC